MRPTRWRRSTHVAVGVAVIVLVAAVVAVAALFTGHRSDAAEAVRPVPAPATASPGIVPVDISAPTPTEGGLEAALAPALADPNLGMVTGRITDADTGAALWEQGAELPMQPASVNKVLTTAAALLTLDRDARLTTTVLASDSQPGLVVLHGGGDPTLSAAPADTDTWYKGAARISDLADQIRQSGVRATTVRVDTSLYSGPTMAPGWDPADIAGGDIAPMESVMLDGGRTQPTTVESRRSTSPALDAGKALAAALRIDPETVTLLPSGLSGPSTKIAEVQSAPLIERLRQMMNDSDNVMAESIAREVAEKLNRPQSFEGGVDAVLHQLEGIGIDTTGADLVDSSGLSIDDRLTAKTLDEVVNAAAGHTQPALRPLVDLLPIAGGSGTLSNRYLDTEGGKAAAGWLRAKTGSLTGTNALAGIVTDDDGRVLTFALISNNAGPTGRTAIDALAAVLRTCGCGT
ncbi:D-alanyl-D-alanine carboxypeptidase/D-alanyl-D-alanine-endopeptidase [Mycolicibacterium wolinskyi]|uniref:D-alanyl-D-alanine carboxypeptidase n=1 Tax=Mycolicibacterium wolinskyi TaxID=59750 RepID=A0A1X2FHQ9_9MYCO|nr:MULTISPECIES: D-alanyl-D-alanine carboxypeptidase/D-alanyl-D-alanine-endopeptidase [Mycolicibacterium]MCV7284893.1 D-alanyl-D-alanine carboxypeptidase/D-alanyl-D-alanine-endopeptidase [Mycolicibacterium wolinskyi]MCV7297953.1 D-alanyl-D-alanine carboxypeptidase/D-alanyl-D-alanine-endopeptidase [Mycolicibacterium goodii]ORX17983.1 D-alanyl-D-alanine carboxypeptidase [Mycolicibacterium wolinskyi]